uniref:Vitellogenin 1 n=1 Tax=Paracyclopina nana TaxID=565004 RepID=D4N2J8_PARNA|nr:vitellogenin 1 [Paracyclopina nana]
MKCYLAILLFVGAALSNSTHFYGWKPEREFVFRFESKVDSSIPEIRSNQKAGVKLTSLIRVQAKQDYSLIIKLENPKFWTFNGIQDQRNDEREQPIPEPLKAHLEKPFKAHLRRGVVESLFVESNEPNTVTNIKKAVLANLNMDLSASRRNAIESNRLEMPDEQALDQSPLDQSYFTVREQSLHGDCQTSYNIHELPQYEAEEIEEQMQQEESRRNQEQHLQGGLSQGREVCRGKKYWQVSKTRNFDNCVERPVYQKWTGVEPKCDVTKSGCKDLTSHMSTTNYIVCGDDIREFVIRKSETENTIMAHLAWKTEEKFLNKAKVIIELIKEEAISSPIQPPKDEREIKDLIFEFPEKTYGSNQNNHGNHEQEKMSEQEKNRIEQESGVRPVLPKPSLRGAPWMLVSVPMNKEEIAREVVEQMKKISREIYESPDSCTSKGDVAGHLNVLVKALRPLSYDDLKYVESKVEAESQRLEEEQQSGSRYSNRQRQQELEREQSGRFNGRQRQQQDEEQQQQEQEQQERNQRHVIQALFYDVMSKVGTNPAVMLMKERIGNNQLPKSLRMRMIQQTLLNVRTPTKELLKELTGLMQSQLKTHPESRLYTNAVVQMSSLIYRACVNPSKANRYPVRIFGHFCDKDSEIVNEWVRFLQTELETEEKRPEVRLTLITAIGKTGSLKAAQVLMSQIVAKKEFSPMVRSLAVYSIKRVAKMEPVHIKPLLLNIIDNIAEESEVRIAAVAILPWTMPTTSELQKVAVRTWFEPSKQFAAFVHSTFKSLIHTKVPELIPTGQKVVSVISLVKPFEFGYQYSNNFNSNNLVRYLDMVISQKISLVRSKFNLAPVRTSWINMVFGSSYTLAGPSFTLYNQGMDKWIDLIMYHTKQVSPASQKVAEELQKITQALNIHDRSEKVNKKPELFAQVALFDNENEFFLDEAKIAEMVEDLAQKLRQEENILNERISFNMTRFVRPIEMETVGPSDAGFPIYLERTLPMVFALRGSSQVVMEDEVPKKVMLKVVPVVNIKMGAHMGVISPFTHELIGTGLDLATHFALPLEITLEKKLTQVTMDIKVPNQVTKEIEAIHVFVTPFTMKKDLRKIRPVSKSTELKVILSGEPLKELKRDIGRALEIDAKLIAETDARYVDLQSYVEKIRQHNLVSLMSSFYLPSTIRMSSAKLVFNPQQSKTKEISLSFSLLKASKEALHEEVQFQPLGKELNDMTLIKEVCRENYKNDNYRNNKCIVELSAIEEVDQNVRSICERHQFQNCKQLEAICHKAREICESTQGLRSQECENKADSCFKRVLLLQNMHKAFATNQIQSGSVVSLRADAALRSQYGSRAVHAAVSVGYQKERNQNGAEVKIMSNVEVKASESPVYEIKLLTTAQVPRVNNRWNSNQILEEALQLILNGKIEYGFETESSKKVIQLKSMMSKSEEQKESVKKSPEYKRCSEEEQSGKRLSDVCEYTRHQSASIDEIKAEVQFPESIVRCPYFNKLGELIKSLFMGQMWEERTSEEESNRSETDLRLKAKFSRTGDEAQLEAEIAGNKYKIINVRIPKVLKGVFPMSMRNPMSYVVLQKATKHSCPPSCRVEPRYVSTFDNKTYSYEMNNCWHLLFKDCAQKVPVAVLAKNLNNEKKEVKILSGITEIIMTPESNSDLKLNLNINGRQEEIRLQSGEVRQFNEEQLELRRFRDNVYLASFAKESLWVLFDGERIEISPSQMLKSRACGLCGDNNGENTADLLTPRNCLMSKPRFAAYTYMIQENSCQGVPASDKQRYEEEKSECVKEEFIPTPVDSLIRKVAAKGLKITRPLMSQHVVEKHMQSGQTCISIQKIRVCSKNNQEETQEPKPSQVARRRLQFVCIDRPSILAQQLEQKALSGESLNVQSLLGQSVAYTKLVYEPQTCQRQSNRV